MRKTGQRKDWSSGKKRILEHYECAHKGYVYEGEWER
jgi:hypothetical protein